MSISYARLRKINCKEELEVICQLAAEDKHDVISPTHSVVKGDKVVGYFSVLAMPTYVAHLSTKDLHARESFQLIATVENLVELAGAKHVITPVGVTSPFHFLFPKMGYKKLANVDLFAKVF